MLLTHPLQHTIRVRVYLVNATPYMFVKLHHTISTDTQKVWIRGKGSGGH